MRMKKGTQIDPDEIARLYYIQDRIKRELEFFFLYDALYGKLNKHLIFRIGEYI